MTKSNPTSIPSSYCQHLLAAAIAGRLDRVTTKTISENNFLQIVTSFMVDTEYT